jgi:tetratricopeptide (TPR) repeat protein
MIQWENDLGSYEERSVARTILNQLDELNQQSRNIGNLLKLLSFLDPENIPVAMIVDGAMVQSQHRPDHHTASDADDTTATSYPSPEFDSLITLIISPIGFQTAIQKLQYLSLVERRSHNGESSLWIHDLIQLMVREHARKDETYQSWLQSSWSLVYGAFLLIEDPALPQWWARCESFISHLHSFKKTWNDTRGINLEVSQANVQIARYFESRGRYGEAEELCEQALEELQKHLGNDHSRTLWSTMNSLANIYWSQGRYDEAEELYKRALEAREKHLGSDHSDTLVSMSNLALVYWSRGRFDEAEELCQRTLEGRKKLLGNDHPHTLWSMNCLANIYWSQGRYDEAEELQKRALEGKEKRLGNDHPHTLWSMNNLADVYLSQERYGEAEELYKRVLEGRKKCLGIDHPHTLQSMQSLTKFYWMQGRYDEAEEINHLRSPRSRSV